MSGDTGLFGDARRRLREIVIEGRIPAKPAPLRVALSSFRALALAALRFESDRGRERAAALAYGTLLALIPIVLLGVSALELLSAPGEADASRRVLDLVFPSQAEAVKSGFLQLFEESRRAIGGGGATTAVRVFSVLLLVYFATSLMTSVDRMVAAIWRTARFRRLAARISAYWAVLTLGPVAIALSFAGTLMASELLGEGSDAVLENLLRFGVTWISVFLFYRLMPHTRVRTGAALAGAAVAGSLWEGSKLAMGLFLSQPKTLLTAMTIFPAAMLWMYVTWLILIYGLEVAYIVQQRASLPGRRADLDPPHGLRYDALTLAVAIEVAAAFDAGQEPTRDVLAAALGASEDHIRAALRRLTAADVLAVGEAGGYRPARGAVGVRVSDLVGAARGRVADLSRDATSPSLRVASDCLADHQSAGDLSTETATLADLVARRRAAG